MVRAVEHLLMVRAGVNNREDASKTFERWFSVAMPRLPFRGVWMSSESCRTHENSNFHPKRAVKLG
jgi:hypothetical protein